MASRSIELHNVAKALSETRIRTFVEHFGEPHCIESAMALYGWNAQTSAAFMVPLHICEVIVRNAVHEVLQIVYGDENWPWNEAFALTLPSRGRYNPRADLINARRRFDTTGKVIPELKFVFWQKMFTSRHKERLWNDHLLSVFPNHPADFTTQELMTDIYEALESIRTLRNRIAHHEHIINRDLANDLESIVQLITYRCEDAATWLNSLEGITELLDNKPTKTYFWSCPNDCDDFVDWEIVDGGKQAKCRKCGCKSDIK
ncbi:hypothetical protein K0504_18080 [Neiella marina]|uniref:Abi-like protein n=1 Tax=Neiella holothuriorum TaxID=2870530 RepID=A0ABS7EL45_9GAMM|nr:hypothetical protein [Neiella holothuriorum]MBW8192944.1 hypothetical protein [Neiella holothuriorum]